MTFYSVSSGRCADVTLQIAVTGHDRVMMHLDSSLCSSPQQSKDQELIAVGPHSAPQVSRLNSTTLNIQPMRRLRHCRCREPSFPIGLPRHYSEMAGAEDHGKCV
uniref:Uncharacterized protein n=1 Tax=Anguilla anguilla TaxID=7936 RepID=A0A0E9SSL6_ANGAN